MVISQNTDGLHYRSGLPRAQLAELHGNAYLEVCWACGYDQLRDSPVRGRAPHGTVCAECRARVPYFCHCSASVCPHCRSRMKDSIIHFGESLPKRDLGMAFAAAGKADLCLALGSSLRVTPAAEVPAIVAQKAEGKLAIVNLQPTPLDESSDLCLSAPCDVLMQQVMGKMGIQVGVRS